MSPCVLVEASMAVALGAVAQISLPGAPISGHVCCCVFQPLLENDVTALASWVSAATEIAEGVFAYTFVLKSFSDSSPEPPLFEAAKITATWLS